MRTAQVLLIIAKAILLRISTQNSSLSTFMTTARLGNPMKTTIGTSANAKIKRTLHLTQTKTMTASAMFAIMQCAMLKIRAERSNPIRPGFPVVLSQVLPSALSQQSGWEDFLSSGSLSRKRNLPTLSRCSRKNKMGFTSHYGDLR